VNISEVCIQRPVFTSVIMLLLVLVGMVASQRLSLREYPAVEPAAITIYTNYPGATAEIVETEITTPIEDLVSSLEGIDTVTSTSRAGSSVINITFKPSRELDAAAADVRDRIALANRFLPKEVELPVIRKQNNDDRPFYWVSLTGPARSHLELTEIADSVVKDRMAAAEGVGQVVLWSGREYAMRIWIDRLALASYGLTVQDVETALRKQNVNIPAGQVETPLMEMTIHGKTSLHTRAEFENIVVAERDGYLIRLKEVSNIEIGPREERKGSTHNNKATIALGAQLQSKANPLAVSQELQQIIAETQSILPDDVHLETIVDTSKYIKASISNVYSTLFEALILVVLVIFIFLRSFSAIFIPAITIPISLIGVNALMWWWGFSLNTLTLLALVLGIGIVVDDAIVVMENIHRHIENGMKPKAAALRGSKEIFFAIIAMTLTLVAVFAPLGFSEGTTGKLFIEFALTLAGAVLISGFTALTLTPMMCSRILRAEKPRNNTNGWRKKLRNCSGAVGNFFDQLNHRYISGVSELTAKPRFAIVVIAAISVIALTLTLKLPNELAPYEDTGAIPSLMLAPEGTNMHYGQKYAHDMIEELLELPEIETVFTNYGNPIPNMHNLILLLTPWDERERDSFEIGNDVRQIMARTPGMIFMTVYHAPLGQTSWNQPVNLLLQSDKPIEELAMVAGQVMEQLQQNPMLVGLNLDLKLNKPQLEISLDREKLADTGVTLENVALTLETLFGGRNVTEFQRGSKKYDVVVQLNADARNSPSDLREIYMRNAAGELILLEEVIDLEESTVPRQLNHFAKKRVANITAAPAPGYTLGEALSSATADIKAMNLSGITLEYKGLSREYLKSGNQIYQTAALSLVFIYLVLAAQFESYRDPVVILISVPFAVFGAALALHAAGHTFSIYSQIGMITLVGLISKHGIMLVDTANRLRQEGRTKYDAIIESCHQRFRPILMTTAAMTLGAIPLALASGAGAASRSQLGWTIVGGMLGGTILTLLVTPSVYMLISKNKLSTQNTGINNG
jgi:multidrug efflux pump